VSLPPARARFQNYCKFDVKTMETTQEQSFESNVVIRMAATTRDDSLFKSACALEEQMIVLEHVAAALSIDL